MSEATVLTDPQTVDQAPTPKRRSRRLRRPEQRVMHYHVALSNAANAPDILAALSEYNYNAERISQGRQLHAEAKHSAAEQLRWRGEQLQASKMVREAWARAAEPYLDAVRIARFVFAGDIDAEQALMLRGQRGRTISTWQLQAITFYRNLLSSTKFSQAMATYGYDEARLKDQYELVQAVAHAGARHRQAVGEALAGTEARDAKMRQLDQWMSRFYAVARIAISRQPQWLERLGLQQAS